METVLVSLMFMAAILLVIGTLVRNANRREREAERLEKAAIENGKAVIRYAARVQRETGSFPKEVADHLNTILTNPAVLSIGAVTDVEIGLPCICVYTQLSGGQACRVDVKSRWGSRTILSLEGAKVAVGTPLAITPDGNSAIIRRPDGSLGLLSRIKGPGEGVWSQDDFPPSPEKPREE